MNNEIYIDLCDTKQELKQYHLQKETFENLFEILDTICKTRNNNNNNNNNINPSSRFISNEFVLHLRYNIARKKKKKFLDSRNGIGIACIVIKREKRRMKETRRTGGSSN